MTAEVPEEWRELARYVLEQGRDFWSLRDWGLHVKWHTSIPGTTEGRTTLGQCRIDDEYLTATISINFPEVDSSEEMYELLAHEMAHAALEAYTPIHQLLWDISPEGPEARQQQRLSTLAMERTTVRLERAFLLTFPYEEAVKEIENLKEEEKQASNANEEPAAA